MDLPLEDRTAIVTGGGRGIGRGIALCLAEDGADVAIVDLIERNARSVAAEVEAKGRRALAFALDVSQAAPVQAMFAEVIARWGKLDILVNNAGVVGATGWQQHPNPRDEDWEAVYKVNLRSRVVCSEAVMEHMKSRRSGKIINIASIGGLHGNPSIVHYCATKAADIHYTRSLAMQLAPFGVNVNAICPGLLFTDMYLGLTELGRARNPEAPPPGTPAERFEAAVKRVMPLRRGQEPVDVGWMAAFLASDMARQITAQAINVDGGEVLH